MLFEISLLIETKFIQLGFSSTNWVKMIIRINKQLSKTPKILEYCHLLPKNLKITTLNDQIKKGSSSDTPFIYYNRYLFYCFLLVLGIMACF